MCFRTCFVGDGGMREDACQRTHIGGCMPGNDAAPRAPCGICTAPPLSARPSPMAAWRDKGDGQAFPHKPRALTGRWPGV